MNHNSFRISLFILVIFVILLSVKVVLSANETGNSEVSGIGIPEEDWTQMNTIVESIQLPSIPDQIYHLLDFGDVFELRDNVRPALQEAIDQANSDGGGRIIVPAGEWLSKGPIHLKSSIELHISEGAVLRFSEDAEDYLPQVLVRWEGTEAFNLSPLIYAYQASDIAITGGGTIDGNSEYGFGTWRPEQSQAQQSLRLKGAQGVPIYQRVFDPEHYLRPSMITFFGCNRVLLEGVTVIDSPMWVLHMIYTSHGVVRGVTVNSHRLNNDGIVLDSSEMFLVEGNRFTTGDDSVVIKAGRDQDGWRVGRPSQNIVIRNNYMEGHNALAIGSEMSGGVRNIYMRDNELGNVRSAIYFKSNLDRGGYIEHVRVANIDVDRARTLLHFNTNYHSHRGEHHPVRYRDFHVDNVRANQVTRAIAAQGVSDKPIRDVFISNMVVNHAETAIDTSYVENFNLINVMINSEPYGVQK